MVQPRNAYDLKAAYGEKLDLRFTPDAGHSAKDPSNELALKKVRRASRCHVSWRVANVAGV